MVRPDPKMSSRKTHPRPLAPTLYLRRLRVCNMRCFRDTDVAFETDRGNPRMLTMLVGRNGTGKTTFLRALALGLCQQKEASGLIGELAGDFIRQGRNGGKGSRAEIEVSLVDPAAPATTYLTRTVVERDESGQETVRQETEPADFPWSGIFVCGYGVNRGAGHRKTLPSEYRRSDAVASLFNDATALADPESVLKNLKLAALEDAGGQDRKLFERVSRHLRAVLQLAPAHKIEVTAKQVLVHGPWGAMPLHALGDGYRGTSGWLLDFWGLAYLAGRLSNDGVPSGVVLIDDVDEHLHPSWQKKLLTILKRKFPQVQFVATTHSVMSIVNCGRTELLAAELHNRTAAVHTLCGPEGKSADAVLRGEWFGLTSTLDDHSEKLLSQYQDGVRKGLPEPALAPLRDRLRDRLGHLFDSPIDELALEIAAELRKQHRGELPPAQRRQLISEAARRLRERIREKGFTRGVAGSGEEV